MNVRRMFDELRFDRNHHMGLGDIRLTIAQQDEVVAEVDRLRDLLGRAYFWVPQQVDGGLREECRKAATVRETANDG